MLEILDYREDRLEQVLTKLQWPLPGHLGAAWMDQVADAYLAGDLTDADVGEVFLAKYREHGVEDLRRAWRHEKLVESRLPILLDVLKGHEQGLYWLTVPIMLSQIEGIVASAKQHTGRITPKTLEQYLRPVERSGTRFDRVAARFVVKELWGSYYHGDGLPDFNRHAILHGGDVRYGTAANSLRAILYFENIREALRRITAAT